MPELRIYAFLPFLWLQRFDFFRINWLKLGENRSRFGFFEGLLEFVAGLKSGHCLSCFLELCSTLVLLDFKDFELRGLLRRRKALAKIFINSLLVLALTLGNQLNQPFRPILRTFVRAFSCFMLLSRMTRPDSIAV